MKNRLFALPLSLFMLGILSLPVVAADVVVSEPAKVSDVSNNPDDYGYAGIAFDPQEDGTLIVESLLPGSPAAGSELKPKDKIISFKIKEKTSDIYKQLNRTISFNPHKTLQLRVRREEANNKILNINLKIGSYKDNPDPVRFAHAMESRRLFAKAIPFTPKLQKLIGRTPNIIEIYAPDKGPSRVLMGARVLGVKAVSASVGSAAAKSLGESGLPVDKADVYLVTPDGLLYPYLLPDSEIEALKMAKEFGTFQVPPRPTQTNRITLSQNSDSWIAPEEHYAGNMMVVHEHPRSKGTFFSHMHQIDGTWPESSVKVAARDSEQLKVAAREIVALLSSDSLDLKAGQKLCVGEALLYGDSIKANNISRPAFANFKALDAGSILVRAVTGETAVVRVKSLGAPFNTYMYFVKTKGYGWRLSAIRTPVDQACLDQVKSKDASKFDAIAADSAVIGGLDDDKLAEWFVNHKEQVNELAQRCLKELKPNIVTFSWGDAVSDIANQKSTDGNEIASQLRHLKLVSALLPKAKNIFLGLEPIKQSDTGFLYSVDNLPPPINPYGCYWWQKLDDHWYLVRTISGYFPSKLR